MVRVHSEKQKEVRKMFTKLLSVSAGLILTVAGVALAEDTMTTKFTVQIENITKPDAFTASNSVKWSLAFSPGLAVVHTDKAPIFTAGKKDRGKGLEAIGGRESGHAGQVTGRRQGNKVCRRF